MSIDIYEARTISLRRFTEIPNASVTAAGAAALPPPTQPPKNTSHQQKQDALSALKLVTFAGGVAFCKVLSHKGHNHAACVGTSLQTLIKRIPMKKHARARVGLHSVQIDGGVTKHKSQGRGHAAASCKVRKTSTWRMSREVLLHKRKCVCVCNTTLFKNQSQHVLTQLTATLPMKPAGWCEMWFHWSHSKGVPCSVDNRSKPHFQNLGIRIYVAKMT